MHSNLLNVHPREHSARFWRARLGAMSSRGQRTGPAVDEVKSALQWWRVRSFLVKEYSGYEASVIDAMMGQLDRLAA